jgi:hypothetical protein
MKIRKTKFGGFAQVFSRGIYRLWSLFGVNEGARPIMVGEW